MYINIPFRLRLVCSWFMLLRSVIGCWRSGWFAVFELPTGCPRRNPIKHHWNHRMQPHRSEEDNHNSRVHPGNILHHRGYYTEQWNSQMGSGVLRYSRKIWNSAWFWCDIHLVRGVVPHPHSVNRNGVLSSDGSYRGNVLTVGGKRSQSYSSYRSILNNGISWIVGDFFDVLAPRNERYQRRWTSKKG